MALDANPIGIVIIALAALAAGFAILWVKSATFRKYVTLDLKSVELAAVLMWGAFLRMARGVVDSWLWMAGKIVDGAAMIEQSMGFNGPASKAAKAFKGLRASADHEFDAMIRKADGTQKAIVRSMLKIPNRVEITLGYNTVLSKKGQKDAKNAPQWPTGFAHGGVHGGSGSVWVGEDGPELVDMPGGSTVHSNPDSMRMAAAGGGGGATVLRVEASDSEVSEFLVRMIRKHARVVAGGNVQVAFGSGS